jgi:hypothetical protein
MPPMARRQAALDLARQRVGWLISEFERVARELRARRRSDAELARTIGNVVGALDGSGWLSGNHVEALRRWLDSGRERD